MKNNTFELSALLDMILHLTINYFLVNYQNESIMICLHIINYCDIEVKIRKEKITIILYMPKYCSIELKLPKLLNQFFLSIISRIGE